MKRGPPASVPNIILNLKKSERTDMKAKFFQSLYIFEIKKGLPGFVFVFVDLCYDLKKASSV